LTRLVARATQLCQKTWQKVRASLVKWYRQRKILGKFGNVRGWDHATEAKLAIRNAQRTRASACKLPTL